MLLCITILGSMCIVYVSFIICRPHWIRVSLHLSCDNHTYYIRFHEKPLVKGWAQNRALFDRKFKIVRIGRFWRFQRDWMRKICGIAWVYKKYIYNENSGLQLTFNSNSVGNFYLLKNHKSLSRSCTWIFFV